MISLKHYQQQASSEPNLNTTATETGEAHSSLVSMEIELTSTWYLIFPDTKYS